MPPRIPASRNKINRHSGGQVRNNLVMTTSLTPDERERIGARIRSVRKELGLKSPELAARVGCQFNTISDYERGIPKRMVLLPSFASALGVNLAWLETGEGERDAPTQALPSKPQVIDAEFMHRCITVANEWESSFTTAFDRTAIACRLYDTFNDDKVTDDQLMRFLDRFLSFELTKKRQ